MGTHHDEGEFYKLLLQDEVIGNEKKKDIKHGIGTSTGRIPESGFVHVPPEKGMEEIQNPFNCISQS